MWVYLFCVLSLVICLKKIVGQMNPLPLFYWYPLFLTILMIFFCFIVDTRFMFWSLLLLFEGWTLAGLGEIVLSLIFWVFWLTCVSIQRKLIHYIHLKFWSFCCLKGSTFVGLLIFFWLQFVGCFLILFSAKLQLFYSPLLETLKFFDWFEQWS